MKFYYQTGVFVPFAQKHYKQFILAIAAVFMASFGLMTLNAKAATTEVITPVNQQG